MQDEPQHHIAVSTFFKNHERTSAIAWIDQDKKIIALGEFLDSKNYTTLETAILQSICGIPEVLFVAGTSYEDQKVQQVLHRCNVTPREIAKPKAATQQTFNQLCDLLSDENEIPATTIFEKVNALAALQILFKAYPDITSPNSNGQFTLTEINTNEFLMLDASAIYALGVFEAGVDGPKTITLFGLLNQCKTGMGERKLRQWLRQPSANKTELNRRLDIVQFLVETPQLRQGLQDQYLKFFVDIEKTALRYARGRGSLEDAYHLYECVKMLPEIVGLVNHLLTRDKVSQTVVGAASAQTLEQTFLQPLKNIIDDFANFVSLVETVLDLNRAKNERMYMIKPSFDKSLTHIAQQRELERQTIADLHTKLSNELFGVDPVETKGKGKKVVRVSADETRLRLEESVQHGFCFKMSRKDEKLIRGEELFTLLESRKDGIKFTFPALKVASDRFFACETEYQSKQKELESKALEVVGSYVPIMEELASLMGEVDVLCSFAQVSSCAPIPYTRPLLIDHSDEADEELRDVAGLIAFQNMRHPMLEVQDGTHFIPNDLVLRSGKMDQLSPDQVNSNSDSHVTPSFLLVTGPNMGGKSTFIRSAGLVTLLAHVGCFVPCSPGTVHSSVQQSLSRSELILLQKWGCVLTLRDRILCRVGAGDCLFRGVSTFMAEMIDTASILASATEHSLTIVDELGRGTSTHDGCGIAYAIAEKITTEIGAPTLFATHFHELTEMTATFPSISNAHVSVFEQADQITFLFKVQPGPCSQSFGVNVAQMAGFPQRVTDSATRRLRELEGKESQQHLPDSDLVTIRQIERSIRDLGSLSTENMNEQQIFHYLTSLNADT